MARPNDRGTDGRARRDDPELDQHPSHRTSRLLALIALVLVIGGYAILNGCQRQNPDRSVDAYCRQITAVSSLDDALGNLDANGARDAFAQLQALDQVAPNEIEPQLRVVMDASRPLVDTLQRASADQEQALRQVLASHQADMPRVDTAAKAVETYTSTTCHRELETTIPGTTPSSVPSTSTTAFAPAKPQASSTIKAVPPPKSTPG